MNINIEHLMKVYYMCECIIFDNKIRYNKNSIQINKTEYPDYNNYYDNFVVHLQKSLDNFLNKNIITDEQKQLHTINFINVTIYIDKIYNSLIDINTTKQLLKHYTEQLSNNIQTKYNNNTTSVDLVYYFYYNCITEKKTYNLLNNDTKIDKFIENIINKKLN